MKKLLLPLIAPFILASCATTGGGIAPVSSAPGQDVKAAQADRPVATAETESPAAGITSGVVQIDVTVGPQVVSTGLGYWLEHGVVLTALRTVNNVPPNGGLIVRAGGKFFNASTWSAGNYEDLDAAVLYVHERASHGPLPELIPACVDGIEPTPEDRLLTTSGEIAIPDLMTPELTGAAVYSPSGECRRGILSSAPDDLRTPRVTPISAQRTLQATLPKE